MFVLLNKSEAQQITLKTQRIYNMELTILKYYLDQSQPYQSGGFRAITATELFFKATEQSLVINCKVFFIEKMSYNDTYTPIFLN